MNQIHMIRMLKWIYHKFWKMHDSYATTIIWFVCENRMTIIWISHALDDMHMQIMCDTSPSIVQDIEKKYIKV
jgi:hypothetical protein